MIKLLALLLVTVACTSTSAQSQTEGGYSHFDLFAGYSANGYFAQEETVHATNQNVSSFFNDRAGGPAGFEISFARNFTRYFGLKGDFSTYFETLHGTAGTICQGPVCATGQSFEVPLRSIYILAGPEFKLRNSTRFTPFAHTLLGAVHSASTFKTSGTINFSDSSAQTAFAAAIGGGLDLRMTRAVALRTTLDYVPTLLDEATPGDSGIQHHIRISVGALFHF